VDWSALKTSENTNQGAWSEEKRITRLFQVIYILIRSPFAEIEKYKENGGTAHVFAASLNST
jgi:hypothetical protein